MNLPSLVDALLRDTLETSLPLFRSELVLCGTIVLMLVGRIVRGGQYLPAFWLALTGSALAWWLAWPAGGAGRQELFTGMLVHDSLTSYMRLFLCSFLVLFVVLSRLTGIADREDGQDYYTLVLGATLGMCLMSSANHMLTIFLGIEMASLPSYVLAGMVKGRSRSSEAALKYAVYGAGAAGVMLYGISLLCGVLGTAHLPTMARELAALDIPAELAGGQDQRTVMVLTLGGLMLGVGLAFKLSAVPFHFWCPDVFEGASAEVDGFLSVASKGAALALLLRVGLGLGYQGPTDQPAVRPLTATTTTTTTFVSPTTPQPETRHLLSTPSVTVPQAPLAPVRRFAVILIALLAAASCTFGNLAAYGQTNIKRMLAYSTIAHAGYMMMPVAAALAVIDRNLVHAETAVSALLLYLAIYLLMNLGAFAIVAYLRNALHSEEIKDYAGLIRSCPVTTVMMTVVLVSLIGLPPLAGFWPKLRVLQALYEAGGFLMMFLLVVAALNTVIGLVYYLRVAKTMCLDPAPDARGTVRLGWLPVTYILLITVPILVFGILPEEVAGWAQQAARHVFQ